MTTKVLGKEVKSYSKGSFKSLDPIDRAVSYTHLTLPTKA